MPIGRLHGLALGQVDPELLTLKASWLLPVAPVVAYPVLDSGKSLCVLHNATRDTSSCP
jgi:precorrin-2 methylase